MKKLTAVFLSLLMIAASGCGMATSEGTPAGESGISGTWSGTGNSIEGYFTVNVTLENSRIEQVEVEANLPEFLPQELREKGINAANAVAEQIQNNNAVKADVVSGATVTSQAVLDGASEALVKAGVLKEEDCKAKDGTYSQMIFGNNDMISVEVDMKDNRIEAVRVLSDNETPGVGGALKAEDGTVLTNGGRYPTVSIPQEMSESHTISVDTVTGATVSSYAVITAVKECIAASGSNPYFHTGEVSRSHETEETADVVIVGAGGSGLAAAVRLLQEGKSVILVEKNGAIGGNTLVCGAIYNCPDEELQDKVTMSDAQKETVLAALKLTSEDEATQKTLRSLQETVTKQWEAYLASGDNGVFDSEEWYTLQTWTGGDMVADIDLVKTLCTNADEGYAWIRELGMNFDDEISQGAGSLWQRTHTSTMNMGTGFISTYAKQLEEYSDLVTIRTEFTATELIMDGDRVAGVKAISNNDGSEEVFMANDGVIISTGGFSANTAMVQENNTSGKWPDLSSLTTTNRASATGDGITMASQAGASLTDMDQIQLLYLGNLEDGSLTKYPPRDVNGTDQIIFINKEGKRFVREDGRRDEICLAVLKQTDGTFYMLESGDGEYKDIHDESWKSADGFSFAYLEENGYVISDETLEGVAQKLGMDPDVLKETIDSFNESVDGKSDEFGRTLYSVKLENGPWVATPRQVSIHHTMGGIHIDSNCHALTEENEIIQGLYAAGEVCGGVHGANRLGGNAVVETVVFGKQAAETILQES